MEFDSLWFGRKRSRFVTHLHPKTVELIKLYGAFYGVDPDQLVEVGVNKIMSEDEAFVLHARSECKRGAPSRD